MTRGRATAAGVLAVLLAFLTLGRAGATTRPVGSDGSGGSGGSRLPATAATVGFERHHYSIAARVRPLLVFWLSRSGVGDAVVTRRRAPGEARYSLLIGSDPDHAPRRINRWGYIEENIRGAEAHLIGLMTESEEESLEQAEAGLRKQAGGHYPFRVIQATVNGEQASSLVTSLLVPENYTFRQMRTVLGLALRESSDGKSRVLRLPPGTRPGFLAALADVMHTPSVNPVNYVYHGRLYELRQTRARAIPSVRIARAQYGPAIDADFVVTSAYDGEQTRFSMTYGTEGRLAEVPLAVTYQPRWWMQVELTIDDSEKPSPLSDGMDQ